MTKFLFVCLFLLLPKLWRHAHSTLHISHSAPYFHMWPPFLYNTFPHVTITGSTSVKEMLKIKWEFWISLGRFFGPFHYKRHKARWYHKYTWAFVKTPTIYTVIHEFNSHTKNQPFWISSRHFLISFIVRSLWFLPDSPILLQAKVRTVR